MLQHIPGAQRPCAASPWYVLAEFSGLAPAEIEPWLADCMTAELVTDGVIAQSAAQAQDIRELDMVTGKARTLFMTSGSPFSIRTSPQGDLWYLREEKKILDLNGNQVDFTDESQVAQPLKDGKVAVYPRECVDTCTIKVIMPFENALELTYNYPWVIESASIYNTLDQVLPDQSLLVAGRPSDYLSKVPAGAADFPGLLGGDSPFFRLTPDGQARLVGIYIGNASADGRYMDAVRFAWQIVHPARSATAREQKHAMLLIYRSLHKNCMFI